MPGETVVKTIQKNDRTQVRILVSEYKGNDYVHIREFWRKSEDESYQHGKGITFPYDNIDMIDGLIDGLNTIKKALEQGDTLEQDSVPNEEVSKEA